jgi:hypothetical protein
LARQTTYELSSTVQNVHYSFQRLSKSLGKLSEIIELPDIEQQVLNGPIRFPREAKDLANGVSVEFRFVFHF